MSSRIAVIGYAARVPGASNVREYFQNLCDAVESITRFSDGELLAEGVSADLLRDPAYVRAAPVLADIARFDAALFEYSPREARIMDPAHRILLELGWEALEDAGYSPRQERPAGVFVGGGGNVTSYLAAEGPRSDELVGSTASIPHIGNDKDFLATRLSFKLNLTGPSMTVQTACSTSLVTVHLACQSLLSGECDMALAGGIGIRVPHRVGYLHEDGGILSPDGHCRPFDERARGTLFGSGGGLVVLKRLEDAVADGDDIRAVILGSAVNNDGATKMTYSASSADGIVRVVTEALGVADVKADTIGFVEAHGTATMIGDPIEVAALARAFRRHTRTTGFCKLGSVKSNVGHLEQAAGIASLIKTICVLERGLIPPTLHFEKPNPRIDFERTPFVVNRETVPWKDTGGPRRAAVSSLGLGGTNAHLILEEAPRRRRSEHPARPIHLLRLSAQTSSALTKLAADHASVLAGGADVQDVCFTVNTGRAELEHRALVTGSTAIEISEGLRAVADGEPSRTARTGAVPAQAEPPHVAFLFTGQGSQYAAMGRELYETEGAFRQSIDRSAKILASCLDVPLIDLLFGGPDRARLLDETKYTQPALFAIELALAETLASWGIKPSFALGHSIGEYVAATLAGVFDAESGLRLVAERGRLMQSLPRGGAMLAAMGDADVVQRVIADAKISVSIAAINGPEEVVLSGGKDALAKARVLLDERRVRVRELTVSHAFHSSLMDPILDEFEEFASRIPFQRPHFAVACNVTGKVAADGDLTTARYWRDQLRGTVRFADGLDALYDLGARIFVELGPHPILSELGMRREQADAAFVPTLRRGTRESARMLLLLQTLCLRGVPIDWHGFHRGYGGRRISLPSYPFEGQALWVQRGAARPRFATERSSSTLLGRRLHSPVIREVVFEGALSTQTAPFLVDHRVRERLVLPAAAYALLAMAAGKEALESEVLVEELSLVEACSIDDDEERALQTIVRTDRRGGRSVQFYTHAGTTANGPPIWQFHAEARVRVRPPQRIDDVVDLPALLGSESRVVDGAEFYEAMASAGFQWGPTFRGLERISLIGSAALGRLRAPPAAPDDALALHPGALDACLQLALAAGGALDGGLYLPIGVESVRLSDKADQAVWGLARARELGSRETIVADVSMLDESGRVLGIVKGYSLKRVSSTVLGSRSREVTEWLYEVAWQSAPPPVSGTPPTGTWIVFADRVGTGSAVGRLLEEEGNRCVTVLRGEQYAFASATCVLSPDRTEHVSALFSDVANSELPPIRGIVLAWGSEPSSDGIGGNAEVTCVAALHIVQALSRLSLPDVVRFIIVTRGAHRIGDDLVEASQTAVSAMAAVIANEHPELVCSALDLDPSGGPQEAILWSEAGARDREALVAYRQGVRYVPRLVRAAPSQRRLRVPSGDFRLVGARGSIESLRFEEARLDGPSPGQVQIQVEAIGLLADDVSRSDSTAEALGAFGRECTGRVVAVGADVRDLAVGDGVAVIANGTFASRLNVERSSVLRLPPELDLADAAALPIACAVAARAIAAGEVVVGQTIVIDALPSGIGFALARLARSCGARVVALGPAAERDRWTDAGVTAFVPIGGDPSSSIESALGDVRIAAIFGSRLDQRAVPTWTLLAEDAVYVHVGPTSPPFFQELRQRGCRCIRVDSAAARMRPAAALEALRAVLGKGEVPKLPRHTFALQDVATALRTLSAGPVSSKLVVSARAPALATVPPPAAMSMAADGWYIVTGGFGALGSRICQWLASLGARNIAVLSRSGDRGEAAEATRSALEAAGVRVLSRAVDVSDRAGMTECLGALDAPIRGVVHAAGVLDDGVVVHQTQQRLAAVLAPKIKGAILLHELTAGQPLDFFVMFSSVAPLLGTPGQASYAAANGFLDGLASYRRSLGLPALSVNWGPWAGGGMATRVASKVDTFATGAAGSIPPELGLEALERLIADGTSRAAVLPFRWGMLVQQQPTLRGVPMLSRLLGELGDPRRRSADHASGVVVRLGAARPADRPRIMMEFLEATLVRALGLDPKERIDPQRGFMDLGLDSMLSVQVRNELQDVCGKPLPYGLTFSYPNLQALTRFLLDVVFGDQEVEEIPAPTSSRTVLAGRRGEISMLSEADLEAWLEDELKTAESMTILSPNPSIPRTPKR